MRRTRFSVLAALAVAGASAGCRQGERRAGEVDPSTVSRRRASFAPGTVIPPSGFGVDLVRRKGATIDPSTAPASGPLGDR